ncbi:MAG: hypothetical protein SGI89_09065 [bacterium]|nr:hypothetical protein [bacterium]
MRPLIIVLIFVYSNSFGQETKFVLKDGGGFQEEYYVLKSDKKIKHGTYAKYRAPFGQIVMIETCNYSNGEKHGQWTAFYNEFSKKTWNKIRERGNYVNGKKNGVWVSYYLDTAASIANMEKVNTEGQSKSVSVNIEQKTEKLKQAGMYLNDKRVGEWTSFYSNGNIDQKYNFSTSKLLYDNSLTDTLIYNTDRKPLFIGGQSRLSEFLLPNRNLINSISNNKEDSTKAIIMFFIDEQGRTENITIDANVKNKSFKDEITKLIASTDLNWIPGLKEGTKTKQSLRLSYNIIRTENLENTKRWRSFYKILE